MPEINTDFIQARMSRAIPGESFANDPDTPLPFEKAPEFVSVTKASEFIFERITEEDNYMQFLQVIAEGAPLMEVAKVLLYSMYEEGKINPDLLVLLIEPTVYILMALCERADVQFTIDGELGEEEEIDNSSEEYEILQRLQEAQRSNEIPLPQQIEQRLQEIRPPPQESPPEQPSLLGMEQ